MHASLDSKGLVRTSHDAYLTSDPEPSRHFMTNMADGSTTLVDGFKTTRRTYGGCMTRMASRLYLFLSKHFCIYYFGFIL